MRTQSRNVCLIGVELSPGTRVRLTTGHTINHQASHAKPSRPENANAVRQPKCSAISGIVSAAIAPPTLEPLSKIATAIPRSCGGKLSATAFDAPGQLKPSPMPSRKRRPLNIDTLLAKLVARLTSDHH